MVEAESKEAAYKYAQNMGVDMSTVALCRKIRNMAKLNRLTLDMTTHRSPQNTHLFDYIRFCGRDPLEFIKEYLSNLQPYMITRNQSQEPDKSFLCILDNQYVISIYIKMNVTQNEEMIISFHENHIRGIAKLNRLERNNNLIVPVFAENVTAHVPNTDNYVVRALFQRGILTLPLELSGEKCADVFLVRKSAIDTALVGYCNDYLQELYTSNLKLDFDKIELFSVLQQLSFTSYGKDVFSSLSLLTDNLFAQPDKLSRCAADFALVTYAGTLTLTEEQKDELCDLLTQKYQVSAHKDMWLVLERIKNSLFTADDSVKEIKTQEQKESEIPEVSEENYPKYE